MIIAGEGHEQPTLERLVEELNLRDNIDFLGRQSPRAVCWAADFILLGSTREGFALSIVEAMACGVVPLRTPSAGGGRSNQAWSQRIYLSVLGFRNPR
jgi:glycosyltransferase involved in cell wall biosynthesis